MAPGQFGIFFNLPEMWLSMTFKSSGSTNQFWWNNLAGDTGECPVEGGAYQWRQGLTISLYRKSYRDLSQLILLARKTHHKTAASAGHQRSVLASWGMNLISIVIRTHSYKIHKRDREKMPVILLNPDAALNQALQTVGKIKEKLQYSWDEILYTCAYIWSQKSNGKLVIPECSVGRHRARS